MATREEHYAEGEKLLDRSEHYRYPVDIDQKILWAAQAQAHFLAALAATPPLVEVRPADRNLIVGGVFETEG